MSQNILKKIIKKETSVNTLSQFTNFDAEIAVIGCLLWDNRTYEKIADFLIEEHFTDLNNRKIFKVIKRLLDQNILVTPITLKNYLDENDQENFDNYKYLIQIKDSTPSTQNTYQYAKLLYDLHIKRSLLGIGNGIIQNTISSKDDLSGVNLIEKAENDLYNLSQIGSADRKYSLFRDALKSAINIIDKSFKKEGKIAGIPTGLKDLDKKLGGLHNSDLIIIAGRPSMGKTSLATNIAFHAAKNIQGKNLKSSVAFFSLEMSSEQLATRILSEQARIKSNDIRRGKISEKEMEQFIETSKNILELPLYIDETPAITIAALSNRARRIKRLFGLDLVVVDYIQLMRATSKKNDGRVQEISEITQGLKALAKELNVPVLALSQLSRAVELRDDKKPQLSDLRESGSIEQDADVVMFVYREEYYLERKEPKLGSVEHAEWQTKMNDILGLAEIILGKQRHGPTGNIKVEFESMYTKFKDLENKQL